MFCKLIKNSSTVKNLVFFFFFCRLKSLQNEITNTRKANVEQMCILKRNNQNLLVANEKIVKELDQFENKFQEYKIKLFEKNDEINDLKKQLQNKMEILQSLIFIIEFENGKYIFLQKCLRFKIYFELKLMIEVSKQQNHFSVLKQFYLFKKAFI